jgi:hypothetical protein
MPCFFEGAKLIHVFTTATAQPDATVVCHCGCTRYITRRASSRELGV